MKLEFSATGTHRIEFDDGWVDIKDRQSYGDQLKVSSAATRKIRQERDEAGDPDASLEFDLKGQRMALFETAIVAWSNERPPKRAAFESLDGAVGDWLADQIIDHYNDQKLSEIDLGNSNGRSSAPSEPATLSRVNSA